jgi:hypothetical protein
MEDFRAKASPPNPLKRRRESDAPAPGAQSLTGELDAGGKPSGWVRRYLQDKTAVFIAFRGQPPQGAELVPNELHDEAPVYSIPQFAHDEPPLIDRIRRASNEDVLTSMYSEMETARDEDDDQAVEPAYFDRMAALGTRLKAPQLRSLKMIDDVLAYWQAHAPRYADVIASLNARKLALGGAPAAQRGDDVVPQILQAIADLKLASETGEDGCERRAHKISVCIADHFPDIGVGHLTKVWTFPHAQQPLHPVHHWKWHVAPCVVIGGKQLVFDSILLDSGVGPLETWLGQQHIEIWQSRYRQMPWEVTSAPDEQKRDDEAKEFPEKLNIV